MKNKSLKPASKEQIEEILRRGTEEAIDAKHLEKNLTSGAMLRIKLGADPTAPDLHLGHAVVLRKLREFQKLGHTVVFLIGDYTALIGDPSGKSKTRPQLTAEEVERNAKSYFEQVGKVLDLKKCVIRYNSEWFGEFSFADLIKLASNFSVARILERDDFTKRLKEGIEIGAHEILYPMMQAYDSVMINASVEIGGTDQRFNMLAGRDLQRKMNMPEQDVIMCPLLIGLDGEKKMSKSLGNYIGLTDAPNDMYGKVMSIPDKLIMHYFELATELPLDEIKKIEKDLKKANPRDVKMMLAREIVIMYHSEKDAKKAEENFISVFQKKERPEDVATYKVKGKTENILEVLVNSKLVSSKGEGRRLIEQGGVKVNEETVKDINFAVKKDSLIQKGKRFFVKAV
jgi:tyrosyl-tRNA synthetase